MAFWLLDLGLSLEYLNQKNFEINNNNQLFKKPITKLYIF